MASKVRIILNQDDDSWMHFDMDAESVGEDMTLSMGLGEVATCPPLSC